MPVGEISSPRKGQEIHTHFFTPKGPLARLLDTH